MLVRAAIVTVCLLVGAVVIARASKSEVVPPRESLSTFPLTLGEWQGQRLPNFDDKITAVLGVDEYVNAAYYAPNQSGVGLYIGYYHSQREGDTMHSPIQLVCPDLSTSFDTDKAKARETRRAMLETAMEDRRILVPCHFRGKLGCRLARHGDGFVIAR